MPFWNRQLYVVPMATLILGRGVKTFKHCEKKCFMPLFVTQNSCFSTFKHQVWFGLTYEYYGCASGEILTYLDHKNQYQYGHWVNIQLTVPNGHFWNLDPSSGQVWAWRKDSVNGKSLYSYTGFFWFWNFLSLYCLFQVYWFLGIDVDQCVILSSGF